jgi:hypothetical protein
MGQANSSYTLKKIDKKMTIDNKISPIIDINLSQINSKNKTSSIGVEAKMKKQEEEAEEIKKTSIFPKGIYFILLCQFFASLSLNGVKSVLSIYLNNFIGMGETCATSLYHGFLLFSYFSTLLGKFIITKLTFIY